VTAIRFDNVTLRLGARTVLSTVDLSINEGEFVGLLGANGSGKTTLFRAVLGLIAPAGGAIRVLGETPGRGNPKAGYLPQARRGGAELRLRGADFVLSAAGGDRWGLPWPSAADRQDAAWALEMVDGAALADRPLAELSGGERQRLMLAQALLGKPKLLLLDEPLIGLDPSHQAGAVSLVKRLQEDLGITVLFSAHELNPLLGALDRVLYLGGGHAALGTVDEIITGPVLSRLYGSEIEVLRQGGRIFVLAEGHDVGHAEHDHDGHRHA
jgi:zinc/manganese transport system ATP-binding protein